MELPPVHYSQNDAKTAAGAGSYISPTTTADASEIARSCVVCVIIAASVVGNLLAVLVIIRTRRLHRINNALVVSLIIADLLRAVVVMPTYIVLTLTALPHSSALSWICSFYYSLGSFCDAAVVLSCVLIGVERAFVISKPLVYQRVVTWLRIGFVICALWVTSLVYGSLQLLRYSDWPPPVVFPYDDFSSGDCFVVPTVGFAAFDFAFTFVAASAVIVVSYGKIVLVVRSQMKKIAPGSSVLSEAYYAEQTSQAGGNDRRQSLSHSQVTRHQKEKLQRIQEDSGVELDHGVTKTNNIEALMRSEHASIAIASVDGRPTAASNSILVADEKVSGETDAKIRRTSHGSKLNYRVLPTDHTASRPRPLKPLHDDSSEELPILSPILNSHPNSTGAGENSERRRSSVTFKLDETSRSADYTEGSPAARGVDEMPVGRSSSESVLQQQQQQQNNPQQQHHPQLHHQQRQQQQQPSRASRLSQGETNTTSLDGSSCSATHGSSTNLRRTSQSSLVTSPSTSRRGSLVPGNRNKAFTMTLIVVGTFVIGWLPVKLCHLLTALSAAGNDLNSGISPVAVDNQAWDVVQIIAFLVSALDPLVYNFYSAEFRRSFRRLVTCDADKHDIPWS